MQGTWIRDWDTLIERLLEESENGDVVDCEVLARDLIVPMDKALRTMFLEWVGTRKYDASFAPLGWSIDDIKKHNMCSTAKAFYWMDMLFKKPERALHFLNGPATTVRVTNWRLPKKVEH